MSGSTLLESAKDIQDWMVDLRRTLHRHPELMYQEFETSKLVQRTLTDLGVDFRSGIAETGVLAQIGDGAGPCVALRADMDALPIHEEAAVDFRSEIDGKMHACGHDCHTAMLLGAARLLKARESELGGTVKLLFQPAEEGGAGGMRMCDEGALEGPDVARIFGLHVWPTVEMGCVAARAGTLLAASGEVQLCVHGKGGHAAMPHAAIDPLATAAKIVLELQTIVSRELDPMQPGVISMTTVRGGEAFNVIPPRVELGGTLRSTTMDGLRFLQNRVREIASGIAAANRCSVDVEFPGHDYPPTVNDAECWRWAQDVGTALLGADHVSECSATMGGEDFAFYTERIPACFVFLGVRNEAIDASYSVHHPKFKPDENALPIGAAMHVGFALRAISELKK